MPKINITYKNGALESTLHTPFVSNHTVTTAVGAKRIFCHYSGWKAKDLRVTPWEEETRFKVQGIISFYTKDGGYFVGNLVVVGHGLGVAKSTRQ